MERQWKITAAIKQAVWLQLASHNCVHLLQICVINEISSNKFKGAILTWTECEKKYDDCASAEKKAPDVVYVN